MKIAIAIFAYNRSVHLQKVINGLRLNKGVTDIYIFQDGLKQEKHREEWEKTTEVIKSIDWCNVKYILAPENMGLAKSIVDGINLVFEENDAIIVLEDDCVPAEKFVSYMRQCFEKYENYKNVYNITGYSYPIKADRNEYDVYFAGRTCSWGWGTWKDRWATYSTDNSVIGRIKEIREKSISLAIWGNDLEAMLNDRVQGKNDSWAVYWALSVIEKGGACVVPYVSLIQNIGFDGTGVHCEVSDRYNVEFVKENKEEFLLPNKVEFLPDIELGYAELLNGYTVTNLNQSKEKILVYGLGGCFRQHEKAINEQYYVNAFVDRTQEGFHAGKRIIKAKDISGQDFNKILIMLYDKEECSKIKKMLMEEYNVAGNRIEIFES